MGWVRINSAITSLALLTWTHLFRIDFYARDLTDTFVTAMYTVHSDHILGTDLFRIEIYQMCHLNAAIVNFNCVSILTEGGDKVKILLTKVFEFRLFGCEALL